jgi:hypothetical protein
MESRMAWVSMAMPYPVTYKTTQQPMKYPILGIVLHTTNPKAGTETLQRFQRDWQAGQAQTAHFMVDRSGGIGQYRALTEVAWHIGKWSPHYIGIEHIAHPDQLLKTPQTDASGQIVAWCIDNLGIPFNPLETKGGSGIGIHVNFSHTHCGRVPFWSGSDRQTGQFQDILDAAASYMQSS